MNAEAIFHDALARPRAERPGYLAGACAGDEALRRRVEALLHAHENPGSFLAEQPHCMAATAEEQPIIERPGTVIGPYKLMEQIGEGGMGLVFVAEQQHPVRRKVALKVIKPGMDTRQVVARFEAERQALALMDHPNIAKVHDGGQTASGRPFFVMELVKGIPITEYCDQNQVPIRERLELFLSVCQAVQHAHQKGIIHRDLKPSNVLVMSQDGTPVVKVIDFGIAKAVGQQLTDKTVYTQFAQLVGTPLYMSPEQAGQSSVDVDTRSDIYSLGVLLYELLTGATPFDAERLHTAGFDEMRRIIREEEPPWPSTRLSTLGQAADTVSTNRKSDPKRLSRLFRGELDWVVMKALEKDRNRRYESASAFAADVLRYLHDEPVQACPPSAGYRLRKFVRRNKALLTTVLLVVLAVLLGTGVSIWQAVRATNAGAVAETERDRALRAEAQANARRDAEARAHRRTRDTLSTMTDEVSLQLLGKSTQLTEQQKQFLQKVRRLYEDFAASQDDVPRGRLDRAVGYYRVAYFQEVLGEHRQAEASYREALEIVRPLAADFPEVADYRVVLGSCYDSLARFLRNLNRFDEAEAYFGDALTVRERLASDYPLVHAYHSRLAGSHLHLGSLLEHTRRPEQAITEYRKALAIWQRLAAESPNIPDYRRDVAAVHGNLSIAFIRMRRLKEAEDAGRESVSAFEKLVTDFPDAVQYREDLANAYQTRGALLDEMRRFSDAETAVKAAIALRQQLAADYPALPTYRQRLAGSFTNLGKIHRETNQLKAAEAAMLDALALRHKLAKDFPIVPEYQRDLGEALVHVAGVKNVTGNYAEARQLLDQAQASIAAALKTYPNDPYCRHALRNLHGEMCLALLGLGQHVATVTEAEEFVRFAVDPVGDLYDAACFVARSVPLAQKDAKLQEPKRKELAAQYAGRAVALLRQAIDRGWTDADHMRKDSDLDSIRSRMDFHALVRELEEKTKSEKRKQ